MIYKSLNVMALETRVAEERVMLGQKKESLQSESDSNVKQTESQTRQQVAIAEVSNVELEELQKRIKDLQAQVDSEKHDRECLQEELAGIHEKRAAEKEELCQKSHNAELFQQTLDQIVDACVKQKQARKTAHKVGKMWLGLVRNKSPEITEEAPSQPPCFTFGEAPAILAPAPMLTRSRTQELAQKVEELSQARQETP